MDQIAHQQRGSGSSFHQCKILGCDCLINHSKFSFLDLSVHDVFNSTVDCNQKPFSLHQKVCVVRKNLSEGILWTPLSLFIKSIFKPT